jgi:hypothetical protein
VTDNALTDTTSFDLDRLPGAAADVFTREGTAATVHITSAGTEEVTRGCKAWPETQIVETSLHAWRFGLAREVATPLQVQSAFSNSNDSAALAAAAIRLITILRDSSDAAFSGVPFTIGWIYQLGLGDSDAFIADAVRRINTEATAREQHVLFIAEKPRSSREFRVAYVQRRSGREETVQVPDLLGAVRASGTGTIGVFVTLDYTDGLRVIYIERESADRWQLRWQSAYAGC